VLGLDYLERAEVQRLGQVARLEQTAALRARQARRLLIAARLFKVLALVVLARPVLRLGRLVGRHLLEPGPVVQVGLNPLRRHILTVAQAEPHALLLGLPVEPMQAHKTERLALRVLGCSRVLVVVVGHLMRPHPETAVPGVRLVVEAEVAVLRSTALTQAMAATEAVARYG
jgi:hypothetical protein